mgnify:CR=1 FL=1
MVVDPRRDIDDYLADAAAAGLTIVGVINTHFHADFVSGHLELAEATGAWIGYGDAAAPEFAHRALADGERIGLGDVTLEIMATPGHTPESISVLVFEHAGDDTAYGVLTGDALFIGDVGRPDLLASVGVSAEELGRMLHDSIQRRLMGLDDAVRVFPAHGAGSACGKNLSTEKQSTIGEQRRFNYACQPMSEQDFVAIVTEGQPSAPAYFLFDAIQNRKAHEVYAEDQTAPVLDRAAYEAAVADGAIVVDARDPQDFAAGYMIGAINVPEDGRFAETVGMVVKPDDKVVIIDAAGREAEVAVRLARIGFDQVVGVVPEIEAWLAETPERSTSASRLTAVQLADLLSSDDAPLVLDVRNPGELVNGTIAGSLHIPLAQLAEGIGSGLRGVLGDSNRDKTLRDFFQRVCAARLACDPCPPPACPSACGK